MCGEKSEAVFLFVDFQGSPPHVRGKGVLVKLRVLHNRITPACAGKRCYQSDEKAPFWDHPRMCGEKTKKIP